MYTKRPTAESTACMSQSEMVVAGASPSSLVGRMSDVPVCDGSGAESVRHRAR